MSFTAVIPEVIAAQIVAGDNGASLALASTALTALAAQLGDTAAIWTSTFAGLTGDAGWQGAGAAAALAAADQYINWLTITQAEVEAAQTAGRGIAGGVRGGTDRSGERGDRRGQSD